MAKDTNAKTEFLNHIAITSARGSHYGRVLCAIVQNGDDYGDDDEIIERTFILTTGYTQDDWNEFLSKLDFMYDSGYGSQQIFATIWYVDGTWSDRGEYDGSEWYQYHICPEIPENVRRKDKERDQIINKVINEK
jgi:hypothetical protein